MGNLETEFPKGTEAAFGRVLNRDLFFFLLDLEVKRARRYQNFLCLMSLKIERLTGDGDRTNLQSCHRTLINLLIEEIRESDIIGSLELSKLVVLLPYADPYAGAYVKSRFEDALKCYAFKEKGFEILVDQVCFPVNGTNTMDLVRKALGTTHG